MGMDVFRPPSVFSYFSPNGAIAGTNGVRGPEFGLLTRRRRRSSESTSSTRSCSSTIAIGANAPAGTSIDLSAMQALAGDPAKLVDALNALLMHGSMSPEMRDSVIGAVSAVAGRESAEARANRRRTSSPHRRSIRWRDKP